jgi:hypothetical protein
LAEEQYTDILNAVAGIGGSVEKSRDSKVYRERLHIFIELLRWTGMISAMRFNTGQRLLMLTGCCATSARRREFRQ